MTRRREHRARFEQSAVPQLTWDMGGLLADANAAFCRLVDLPHQDLLGRAVADLKHASDSGDADAAADDLVHERVEAVSVEWVLRGRGGRPVPVLVDANLLRSDSGDTVGIAAFLQDLSRLKDAERRQQQQEDFFLALAQRASDLAVVTDPEGVLVYISPAIESMLGFSVADRVMHPTWDFIHPEDLPRAREVFAEVVRDGQTRSTPVRVRAADGVWRHLEQTLSHMIDTPVGGIVCNLRDVTERVEAQQALAASEARYRAIVENADEGIWVATSEGRTTFVNSRMLDILGLTAEQVYEGSASDLLGGPASRRLHGPTAPRGGSGAQRYEVDYHHPDGGVRHLSISATPLRDDTGFEGSLALVSDITETRSASRRLQHAAAHDTLTNLPNRSQLQRGIVTALERSPDSTAVLFIDLDHFKVVNDARGHDAGDELLREVAQRLQAAVRPGDLVARFGGDEFVVVCEGVTAAAARAVAERLLGVLEDPAQGAGGRLHATASIGIALSPAESAEQLLRQADAAMYAAKDGGRRTIRFFDASLSSQAEDRYRLSQDLRSALGQGELHLAYQPVVDLRTGAVLGAEALARWDHPDLGAVPPDRFVPIAQENGLAAELDFWAIRTAARDLATCRAAGAMSPDGYVTVNLSSRTLDHPGLLTTLTQAIATHALSPPDLVLEVTEAAVVSRAGRGAATLHGLAAAGHPVAIDDFGTGHSALAYLKDLPATTLKIDRSFVSELATSDAARAITDSIVRLAHGLRMQVIAEGVEDPAQADLLRTLGCDAGQGWLWSPAVSCDDVITEGLLRRTY